MLEWLSLSAIYMMVSIGLFMNVQTIAMFFSED